MQAMLKIDPANEIKSSIAMTLTILSFAMLFAAMLLGYAVFRFNAPMWPPMGMEPVDLMIPSVSSVVIALSSVSYIFFEKEVFKGNLNSKTYLWFTTVLGFVFLGAQTIFWNSLKEAGFYVSSGVFPSLVYGFTWIHAGHIVLALALLIWVLFKTGKMKNRDSNLLWVRNVGKFWHFLGIVWFILYFSIFIL